MSLLMNCMASVVSLGSSRRSRRSRTVALAAAAIAGSLLLGAGPARAATVTWTGLDGPSGAFQNAYWSDSGNWSGSTIPGSTTGTNNTDTAIFTGVPTQDFLTIVTDANRNIGNITFDATANGYNNNDWGWQIGQTSGPALLLTNGGTIQTTAAAASSNNNVNAPLILEGTSYTFTANAPDQVGLNIAGGVWHDRRHDSHVQWH